jgi:transcriptional regulator with XRE-family HTH domain
MATIVDSSLDARIASRITSERESRGWTAGELATRSGVSRGMIGKIERGDARPTASLLGRLAAAFRMPLSLLLARTEAAASRVSTVADQTLWKDPDTGYIRRALSPPGDRLLQLTRIDLPAKRRVAFPPALFAHQQIWVLEGRLTFREGDEVTELRAGDCLSMGEPANCVFENKSSRPCRYLLALVQR